MESKETMETLRNLPDVSGRRFGNLSIGYDRIDQIRAEASTLETLAALLCGCSREDLTVQKVQSVIAALQSHMATLTDEDRAKWQDEDPQKLLAMAVSRLA